MLILTLDQTLACGQLIFCEILTFSNANKMCTVAENTWKRVDIARTINNFFLASFSRLRRNILFNFLYLFRCRKRFRCSFFRNRLRKNNSVERGNMRMV